MVALIASGGRRRLLLQLEVTPYVRAIRPRHRVA
jgi:hypothetical protein